MKRTRPIRRGPALVATEWTLRGEGLWTCRWELDNTESVVVRERGRYIWATTAYAYGLDGPETFRRDGSAKRLRGAKHDAHLAYIASLPTQLSWALAEAAEAAGGGAP